MPRAISVNMLRLPRRDATPSRGRRTASRPRARPARTAPAGSRAARSTRDRPRSAEQHHLAHGEREDGRGERQAHPEPARHVDELGVRAPRRRSGRAARAPCRTSGSSPGRSGGPRGASGTCRCACRSREAARAGPGRDSAPDRRRTAPGTRGCRTSTSCRRARRCLPRRRRASRPFRRPDRRPPPARRVPRRRGDRAPPSRAGPVTGSPLSSPPTPCDAPAARSPRSALLRRALDRPGFTCRARASAPRELRARVRRTRAVAPAARRPGPHRRVI